MNPQIITLIILVIAIILFITEWISPASTALFVLLALYATGILTAPEALSGLTNSAVILTAGMFILGGVLLSCGFTAVIGEKIIKHIKGERNIMAALMITGVIMCAFLSSIGTITILTPLAIGICQSNKEYKLSRLLIPCFIACTTGGMITLIGKPANMVARDLLVKSGLGTVGFFEFAKIGIPISIVLIIFMYFWGYKLLPDTKVDADKLSASYHFRDMKPAEKYYALIVFVIVIVAMTLENTIKIPSHMTALFGILLLYIGGVLKKDKQTYSYIGWTTLFVLGGMLPLATAMDKTGLAKTTANLLVSIMGENPSPVLITAIFFVSLGILTEFMSNTVVCAIFVPIGIAVAGQLGINPVSLAMAVAIASGCAFVIPFGAPLAAYVMEYGNYSTKHYIKVGIPLNIISWAVGVAAVGLFWAF